MDVNKSGKGKRFAVNRDVHRILAGFRSNHGSSAVMVLCVILILTAFGFVSLFASAANIKMGNRLRAWSTEFYKVDVQAEKLVQMVDAKLANADKYVRVYMENHYYDAIPGVADPGYNLDVVTLVTPIQSLLASKKWLYDTYVDYLVVNPGASQVDYQDAMKLHWKNYTNNLYFFFANKLLVPGPSDDPLYQANVLFTSYIVYQFTNPAAWDNAWSNTKRDWDAKPVEISYTDTTVQDRKTANVFLIVQSPDFDSFFQTINIPIQGNPLWGYAIAAEGEIRFNNTNAVAVYGDIIAASRLSTPAEGIDRDAVTVNATGTVEIYGNVYGNGDVRVTVPNSSLRVFDKIGFAGFPGFSSDYYQKMKIYKTPGNSQPSDLLMEANQKLYATTGTYPTSTYTQGNPSASDIIPFVYQDGTEWGNVYCHDLEVSTAAKGGSIIIDGNVVTNDDLEMDATTGSLIDVGGNFVGIRSDAGSGGNPNDSSSVLNNAAILDEDSQQVDSRIFLRSGFVVPGVAYSMYDDLSTADAATDPDDVHDYYQTAESVSAKVFRPFQHYLYPDDEAEQLFWSTDPNKVMDINPIIYTIGIDSYYLKNFINNPADPANNQKNYMYDRTSAENFKSSIYNTAGIQRGYSLGLSQLHVAPDNSKVTVFYKGHANQLDNEQLISDRYSAATDPSGLDTNMLGNIQQAKTQRFGMYNAIGNEKDMIEYVSKSSQADLTANGADVTWINGNSNTASELTGNRLFFSTAPNYTLTLEAANPVSGILYCEGNLTLKGDGQFRGVILCEKNVTIEDSVKILYNEDVLTMNQNSLLRAAKNESIRNFFTPQFSLPFSATYAYTIDYDTTSGARTIVKRYRVMKWLEKQG